MDQAAPDDVAAPAGPEPGAPAPGSEPDLVRPFVMTGGRTRADRDDLRIETLVEATAGTEAAGLPEHRAILAACADGPTSVAEISAHTGLPVGVTTILVADLIEQGAVELHQTDPVDIEVSVLNRMIERVRAL